VIDRTALRPLSAREEADPPQAPPRLSWPLLAVIGACVAVFVGFSVDVTHDGPLARFDPRVAQWAVDLPDGLHRWLWRFTHFGDAPFLAVLILFVVAYLLTRRRRVDAVLLCAAAATTGIATTVLKLSFERSRPPFVDDVFKQRSFSFPSGHASGAFVVYLLVALLLTEGLGRRSRAVAVTAGVALSLVVGVTRVLIPVHYLTDVPAGSAVGITVALATWLVRSSIRSRR